MKTNDSNKTRGVKKAAVKKTSASVSSKTRASASKSKAKKAAVKAKTAPTPDREIENVPRRAGRPKGSGKYNEATKTIRIPVSMAGRIQTLADRQGLVCRLYDDQIQAGFPSPAGDSPFEELDFAEYLIPNPPATFFIRVTGESMRDAGVFPGDILIVDRSLEPTNGDVVVAAVDGDFTVKRLFKTRNSVELRPENKKFPIIKIEGETELVVWGVVKRVIHNV